MAVVKMVALMNLLDVEKEKEPIQDTGQVFLKIFLFFFLIVALHIELISNDLYIYIKTFFR